MGNDMNCRREQECGCSCDGEVRGFVTGYGRFRDDCGFNCGCGCGNDCGCGYDCGCGNGFVSPQRFDGFECCGERVRCDCAHKMITESLKRIKEGIEDDRCGLKAICEGNNCAGMRFLSAGIRKAECGIQELKRGLFKASPCFGCEDEIVVRRGLCHLEKGQHEELRSLQYISRCQMCCGAKESEKGICDLVRGVEEIEKSLCKLI